MKTKFELIGLNSEQPIPNDIETEVKFRSGDKFFHYNNVEHTDYSVKEVKFVLDDCDDQFYQLVSLQSAKYDTAMDAYSG
jgi:hypothetical protein